MPHVNIVNNNTGLFNKLNGQSILQQHQGCCQTKHTQTRRQKSQNPITPGNPADLCLCVCADELECRRSWEAACGSAVPSGRRAVYTVITGKQYDTIKPQTQQTSGAESQTLLFVTGSPVSFS